MYVVLFISVYSSSFSDLYCSLHILFFFFFFQAEDGIRDLTVTGVQTCALPICRLSNVPSEPPAGAETSPLDLCSRAICPRGFDLSWLDWVCGSQDHSG